MNKQFLIAAGVCLGSLLAIGTMPAAAEVKDMARINIPFDTTVGTTNLPAGNYTIRDLQDNGGGAVLEFSSTHGLNVAVLASKISTKNGDMAPQTGIVVRSEGTHHQVHQVWLAGSEFGFEF